MSNTPSEELRLLLQEARSALWQPANAELCERIDDALARWGTPQPVVREQLTTLTIAPVRRCLADRGIYLSDETTKELIVVAHGITHKGCPHGTDN